jgi:hypothetical protein
MRNRGSTLADAMIPDRVETHRVATGLIGDSNVEIREGLAEGEIVVLRAGAFFARRGPRQTSGYGRMKLLLDCEECRWKLT